ncbi:tRNA (guanosine(46)-N7)-methyltransferase TrmB [Paenibacillus physcomitrellae]|uniref:tRNA (guanine-N(7)-)-methyltransferase n=1 Tax=Paenibacillus physcomitrellae TaxID=1619311 RepID=A0ABQ1G6Z9_9BACL|nr:tRNA (guanosine(46)-N7)-methyltransferase TrmB [Paenibacillus physcomitrellae]GGA37989.1 tRNA (guanine-N(7)-)-methyltransferase [Paenibacillus physcomitrellae]
MRLRGRKGIRENLEAQPELIVLDPREYKGRWKERFGNDRPIYVELGMGKGQFISGMSVRYPDVNFIGMDMYDELIRRAGEKGKKAWAEKTGQSMEDVLPPNLNLALGNIEFIEEFFAPGEIERIYLNFSDPWPKAKHGRRRLTHPRFLNKYKHLLNERGEIHFKTDSQTLFEFSLNAFAAVGLQMSDISLNLHREGINENHVMTEYESKFHAQGMNIYRCEVKIGQEALRKYEEHKMDMF